MADGNTRKGHADNLFDLSGKVVLITGGSRGLGREMAFAAARCGADVVVASRKPDACQATADDIEVETGCAAMAYAVHIGRRRSHHQRQHTRLDSPAPQLHPLCRGQSRNQRDDRGACAGVRTHRPSQHPDARPVFDGYQQRRGTSTEPERHSAGRHCSVPAIPMKSSAPRCSSCPTPPATPPDRSCARTAASPDILQP